MNARHLFRTAAVVATALCILSVAPPGARADSHEAQETSAAYDGIVGFGAVLTTLVYAPVKVAYAITGSIVSGLAWLVTLDSEIAGGIIRPALGGDYVVTPAHLEGRRPLRFVGDS